MLVSLFISLRLAEASSSDWPPERKTTPGRAGTIDLERVLTVAHAISCAEALVPEVEPGVTMFGLRRHPSIRTLWSINAFITAANTLSEAAAQASMEWAPSIKISGSTMGTSPLAWQMEAYLAKVWAFSRVDKALGRCSPILSTDLHLANLQPLL